MTSAQKIWLTVLRLTLGFLFLYAGVTKVINPAWSAAGYLKGAKVLPDLYQWLASPAVLPIVNFVNEWGLTLLGISLLLGIFVRLSSALGMLLMLLYYLPLGIIHPNEHALFVDEHIIYIAALGVLAAFSTGRIFGLDAWCAKLPICARYPRLRRLLG